MSRAAPPALVHQPGELADLCVAVPPAELSAAAGVSRYAVADWRAGRALPHSRHLPAISKALGIPLDQVRAAYARDRRERDRRTAVNKAPPPTRGQTKGRSA